MLRQILSVSASAVLLAGLTACGGDDDPAPGAQPSASGSTPTEASSSGSTPPGTPSSVLDDPSALWKKSPGQGDKVKDRLTSAGFGCSEMSTQYARFNACSKGGARGMTWFKYVTSGDGTVLFANTSSFKDVKGPITAVVGSVDANVLLADGTVIKWGYAGPNWVLLKQVNRQPEPPVPAPWDITRAAMLAAYANSNLRCEVEDPEPSETPTSDEPSVSVSVPPEPSKVNCMQRGITPNARTDLNLTFVSDKLTEISLATKYNSAATSRPFADSKAAALKTLNRLWPALKGSDPQAIKEFIEAHLTPTGSAIAYVGNRKVRVESLDVKEFSSGQITIRIVPEKLGLEEPKG